MMKLNRTYLQKRLKNNPLAKLAYEIFVLHNAKRFLDNKRQWKFVQEENLKKIEDHIEQVVQLAAACNLSREEILEMVRFSLEEQE